MGNTHLTKSMIKESASVFKSNYNKLLSMLEKQDKVQKYIEEIESEKDQIKSEINKNSKKLKKERKK